MNIEFKPTYKYNKKTGQISEGKWNPSWTDWIFFKMRNSNFTPIEYNCIDVIISDHLPVYLNVKLQINTNN